MAGGGVAGGVDTGDGVGPGGFGVGPGGFSVGPGGGGVAFCVAKWTRFPPGQHMAPSVLPAHLPVKGASGSVVPDFRHSFHVGS